MFAARDNSRDGTGAIAASLGAEVVRPAELLPGFGPLLGKGDAMWRALSVLTGDLICFVDADSEDFAAHFVTGLLGPLICAPRIQFVKAFYRRPFKTGPGRVEPTGGGRVSELMARPLLAAFYPELGDIRQPLAGEFAARRDLLEQMAFCTGYAVEIGLLLDVYAVSGAGIRAIAQVDLDVRQNRHQPLHDLGPMADAVLGAVTRRLQREGASSQNARQVTHCPSARRSPPCAALQHTSTMTMIDVWTVGHSTHSSDAFLALLLAHEIEQVADVRIVPKSRRHPHFHSDVLARVLDGRGVAYEHLPRLGGWRSPRPDSPNDAWRNASFRGYADYAMSEEFASGLAQLRAVAATRRTAMMCSEALWWRCHRRLIADRFVVAGDSVCHIGSDARTAAHRLTPFAVVGRDGDITYPASP